MTKMTAAACGAILTSIGHSITRKTSREPSPSEAASRKRSPGIASQPCRIMRVASGRLKKTCARITPCAP